MAAAVGERALVEAWQRGLSGPLRTTDGRPLSVIYRGRCPGGAGPDVRGALLAFGGGQLVEGDVEFHLRASDWRAHGHQRDAHYRSVALHVVLEPDVPPPLGADGQPVPTLVLPPDALVPTTAPHYRDRGEPGGPAIPLPWGEGEVEGLPPLPGSPAECHRAARGRPAETVVTRLDQLGDYRLIQRAARFEADLTLKTPEQLAHEALFDALGFSRNRTAFVRLAQAVPIAVLTALVGRRPPADALALAQAILFGVAGLLPSQRSIAPADWETDAEAEELEAVWALYRSDWDGLGLAAADWIFGGVRPANYPTRRIATAARLLVRQRDGLDRALLAGLRPPPARPADLARFFLVDEPGGYWATHADFGRALPNAPAALLGQDRARDAVVNLTLPLALALAATTDDPPLADAAWAVYRAFPRPSAYTVTRQLATELGLGDSLLATARRQQGLLHLAHQHCERAACATCPLVS
jgi:hypothetical protein